MAQMYIRLVHSSPSAGEALSITPPVSLNEPEEDMMMGADGRADGTAVIRFV